MEFTEPRIIKVTEEDIRKGKPYWGDKCPVALALNRALGCKVYVDNVDIFALEGDPAPYHMETPEEVGRFVGRFDDGLPVQPFEFKLELHERADC